MRKLNRTIVSRLERRATIAANRLLQKMQGKQLVHLLHIGKTGGTNVKHAIKACANTNRPYGIYLHGHNTTLRDVPAGEKVVFFLRDPISRFVSGFYSRQRQGHPRYFSPWTPDEKVAFELFSTPNQLAVSLSSSSIEEKEKAEMAMRSIYHVRDSYWKWFECEQYFMSRLSDIFFIGFQETLSEDFEILKSKLCLPSGSTLTDDKIQGHRNPEGLVRRLDDLAITNLQIWYEHDFQFIEICNRIIFENQSIRRSQ